MRAPIRIAPGNIRNTTGGGPRASQRRLFFFNDPAPTEIYSLSLHDVLPILVTKLEGLLAQQPLDDAALTSTTEQLFALEHELGLLPEGLWKSIQPVLTPEQSARLILLRGKM